MDGRNPFYTARISAMISLTPTLRRSASARAARPLTRMAPARALAPPTTPATRPPPPAAPSL
eukprot:scaffold34886_cov76-Phaeocystis_antarctica.AAC.2